MDSDIWLQQLEFVEWLASRLTNISNWIGGCKCHAEDFAAGIVVSCFNRGRRVEEAYGFAVSELSALLEECNSWSLATYGYNAGLFRETQACVRSVYALAMEKIDFLNCVPWLFARS